MASQAKHREAGNLACLSWCLDTRSPAGVAVEGRVAVVVTAAGGNGKIPAIFLATSHVPAKIYAMLSPNSNPRRSDFASDTGVFPMARAVKIADERGAERLRILTI